MKKTLFILILILFAKTNFAQTNGLSVYGAWGYCVPHHADMWNYIENHAKQIDITYFKSFNEKLPSSTHLRQGLGFTLVDPGNPEVMGYGMALYPQIHFPFNTNEKAWFILGCGLQYNTKIYSDENYRLNAISSHFNALILLGFSREFKISDNWSLSTRFNWTHYSNGSIKAPNLGLNIPTVGLSVQHYFKPQYSKKDPIIYSNPTWQFMLNFSSKQLKAEGLLYPVLMLSAERNISPNKRNYWGLGTDIIYDRSMRDKLFYAGDSSTAESDNLKVTVKGTWTVPLERLQISLQAGTYLVNSNFSKEFVFQRLALRYHLNDNIAAGVSLRSHFAKADVIEFGLMYCLP